MREKLEKMLEISGIGAKVHSFSSLVQLYPYFPGSDARGAGDALGKPRWTLGRGALGRLRTCQNFKFIKILPTF